MENRENAQEHKGEVEEIITSTEGVGTAEWNEEDFLLSVDHFFHKCNLPNVGLMPADVSKTLVTEEMLFQCFGQKYGKNGRNGPRLQNCVGVPQSDVLHLSQILDGHERPVNGMLGVIFPRALYAERILLKRINWAAFAHEKLKNQLRTAKTRGDPKPTGPPLLRTHRVYIPPSTLRFGEEFSEGALQDTDMSGSTAAVVHSGLEKEDDLSVRMVHQSKVVLSKKSAVTHTNIGLEYLKSDIVSHEVKIKGLREDMVRLRNSLDDLQNRKIGISNSVAEMQHLVLLEQNTQERLMQEKMELTKKQKDLEMRLDGGFDEENSEDMLLLQSLETEEEDLSKRFSDLLDAESSCREKQGELTSRLESAETEKGDLSFSILSVEREVLVKESTLADEEEILQAQKSEMRFLEEHFESPSVLLNPRCIPTATEVTRTVFRLSSCPVCSLGFHCFNFMPTSCGHTYHPACLLPLLGKSDKFQCLACSERFHPHWLENWGIKVPPEYGVCWNQEVNLLKQRSVFEECLQNLYRNQPTMLAARRRIEKEKRDELTVVYSPADVERNWLVCCASAKMRSETTRMKNSHPQSNSNTEKGYNLPMEEYDEKDTDLTIIGSVPANTRSGSKRKSKSSKQLEKGELTRKVRTRNATMAELSTGIGTPTPFAEVCLKHLEEIETPASRKLIQVGGSRIAKSRRQLSLAKEVKIEKD